MSTVIITVLEAFTEVRTGRTYQAGDVITDPNWHIENDRKAEAYKARGVVKIEPAEVVINLADGVDAQEASGAGRALANRKKKGDK